MTPLEQMKTLAESARSRQRSFGIDAKLATQKAEQAAREAEDFEKAAAILEQHK
jgi:hypothetical protein